MQPAATTVAPSPLLDRRAACEFLGVSDRTIRRVTAPHGPLVPTRIRNRVMYTRRNLERFVAGAEAAAAPALAGRPR